MKICNQYPREEIIMEEKPNIILIMTDTQGVNVWDVTEDPK